MSVLDQLNLRPQERRVLVVVLVLVFIVLNWMFVRPLFGQFGEVKQDLAKSRRTLERYRDEIAKESSYKDLEKKLKQSGSEVLSEELQLQRVVDAQARVTSLMVSRYAPGVRNATGRTNQFFEDQGLSVDFTATSTNLVEFLVGLASGNSMIRVQEMNLKPDAGQMKLAGNILFLASYQRKTPAKPFVPTTAAAPKNTAAAPTNAPATKPKPPWARTPSNAVPTLSQTNALKKPSSTNAVRSASTNSMKGPPNAQKK